VARLGRRVSCKSVFLPHLAGIRLRRRGCVHLWGSHHAGASLSVFDRRSAGGRPSPTQLPAANTRGALRAGPPPALTPGIRSSRWPQAPHTPRPPPSDRLQILKTSHRSEFQEVSRLTDLNRWPSLYVSPVGLEASPTRGSAARLQSLDKRGLKRTDLGFRHFWQRAWGRSRRKPGVAGGLLKRIH